MLKILAFDYGASSGRSILGTYDGSNLDLKETHRFTSDPVMMNDCFQWDFLRLFFEMKNGIIKSVNAGHKDIASIGIDTWGVDFGLLDSKGSLLGNPYHYRDTRTEHMIEKANSIIPLSEIYAHTGIQIQKFNTLYQLLAMKEEKSVLLENAETMLFMPDLFNYFLTGEKLSEYTITTTSQLYNPVENRWATEMLDKLGIPTKILTDVISSGTKIGGLTKRICAELNVSSIPVIAIAEHDTGSAVVSVPFAEKGSAFLSSGTWSLLGVELDKPLINKKTLALNFTNEGGFNNTTRFLKNIMGLWINQECKRHWEKMGEVISFDNLDAEALASTPFASIINVDDDVFYSPNNMPIKIQEYCKKTGQHVPQTKGAIVRCIMESLALKYRQAIEGLEDILGYRIPSLNIVGGGCKNVILSQFTANAINRTVFAGPIEPSAIGNLSAQLISLGELKSLDQARNMIRNSFPIKVYEPQNPSAWDDAYNKLIKLENFN